MDAYSRTGPHTDASMTVDGSQKPSEEISGSKRPLFHQQREAVTCFPPLWVHSWRPADSRRRGACVRGLATRPCAASGATARRQSSLGRARRIVGVGRVLLDNQLDQCIDRIRAVLGFVEQLVLLLFRDRQSSEWPMFTSNLLMPSMGMTLSPEGMTLLSSSFLNRDGVSRWKLEERRRFL